MIRVIKWGIIVGTFSFFLFASAMFYSFAWRPYKKEHDLKRCLTQSQETFDNKQSNIQGDLKNLSEKRLIVAKEANDKMTEFLNNNPEPKRPQYELYSSYTELKWNVKKQEIFDSLRALDNQIKSVDSDSKNAREEKEKTDTSCYKDFK
jgi:hypothetical protein